MAENKNKLNWLLSLERSKGICLGLERINKALEGINLANLGNIIHIGGTNGKASTLTFLFSILSTAGYKVATYTSPHLLSITERIKINDENIKEEDLIRYIEENEEKIKNGELTFFEAFTMLAFLYIKDKKPDFTLCEVGLAGRYDATNIVQSSISIITQIDYDHTDFLGDDLINIAYEEAGIIKENKICITAVEDDKLLSVIRQEAKNKKANLYILKEVGKITHLDITKFATGFDLQCLGYHYKNLKTKLIGKHQAQNASLAILCSLLLNEKFNINITEEHIREGLMKAYIPGRTQIINTNSSTFILDIAHNVQAINMLCTNLSYLFPGEEFIFIIGILKDKDVKNMVKQLSKLKHDLFIIVKPTLDRACDTDEIAHHLKHYTNKFCQFPSVEEGLNFAKIINKNKKNKTICITGSHYTVAEALKYL